MDVDVARHPRAGEIHEHPARQPCCVLGEVRVDALLPAIRARGPQCELLGRAQDPERLEVRRLEQHLRRGVGDLAVLAAHDRRERDGLLAVRDEEIVRVEEAQRAVERAELLARAGTPHDDPAARELGSVERVQRATPDVHDVVRDVDDIGDRAHVREIEARAQPLRRRPDGDVAEHAPDVARAALEVVDSDVDRLLVDELRVVRIGWMEVAPEERCDLARKPHHRQEVDAVHGRRDVEHLVADREDVEKRSARLLPVGQHHDPGVLVSEADLVLGQDHPARGLAPELALVERLVEDRQVRARQRDGHRGTGLEVPCAADDLAGVALPHVDLAHAEAVRVGMRAYIEHTADEEAVDVAAEVGHADVEHALDLERRDREPVSDLLRSRVDGDVLAQPRERRSHR